MTECSDWLLGSCRARSSRRQAVYRCRHWRPQADRRQRPLCDSSARLRSIGQRSHWIAHRHRRRSATWRFERRSRRRAALVPPKAQRPRPRSRLPHL